MANKKPNSRVTPRKGTQSPSRVTPRQSSARRPRRNRAKTAVLVTLAALMLLSLMLPVLTVLANNKTVTPVTTTTTVPQEDWSNAQTIQVTPGGGTSIVTPTTAVGAP